jgi:site-specific DNA-cytosine methylase
LFFEFVRLKNELQPKYFLLENVVMKQEFQDVITEYLGVKPIKINSNLVSAQTRERLYWTNIPNINQPEDFGITLNDILEDIGVNGEVFDRTKLNKATILGRRLNEQGKRDDYNKNIPISQCMEVRVINRDKSNCITTVAKDNVLTTTDAKMTQDIILHLAKMHKIDGLQELFSIAKEQFFEQLQQSKRDEINTYND